MKINWKQKLSSRKFWIALGGIVTAVLIAFNVPDGSVEKISAIIGAFGVMAVYIYGEATVDAARIETEETGESEE